ncbi:MAG TPA: hypothetical protein DDY53_00665 [Clostridiales bacterium]|nr:hypothetical protein [Clostridiales bacterium]
MSKRGIVMLKKFKEIKETYRETKKSTIMVYVILRALVIISMIRQIILGEISNAALCLLSLILFTVPFWIQEKFKITLPSVLEIIILCFIFSAEILGEINNFYIVIPYWDTILHTLNGFLAAGIGFSLVDLLNENISSIKLSPIFIVIVSFCFSMTIGVLWEFFEYGADNILKTDMQKDSIVQNISTVTLDKTKSNKAIGINNIKYTVIYSEDNEGKMNETIIPNGYLDIGINDTMKDLMVNFIGAICFSVFGYLYIINRGKYHFVNNFIARKISN